MFGSAVDRITLQSGKEYACAGSARSFKAVTDPSEQAPPNSLPLIVGSEDERSQGTPI
jgi:hypothetical protein